MDSLLEWVIEILALLLIAYWVWRDRY